MLVLVTLDMDIHTSVGVQIQPVRTISETCLSLYHLIIV